MRLGARFYPARGGTMAPRDAPGARAGSSGERLNQRHQTEEILDPYR
jgi:hypothetical protein